jgi:Cytochrome c554 and c-prime
MNHRPLASGLRHVTLAGVFCFLAASAAAQITNVGPNKCTDCHDHKDEKEWAEKRDGDGKGKQHINALSQLNVPRAATWAAAIGLSGPRDAKGSCVKCHATISARGRPDFGVSCESCHGPGRDYLLPHQEKGAYEKALGLGMKDVWKKPDKWSLDCINCHVLGENEGDPALAKAGHPTGADFDIGTKYLPVAGHWGGRKYAANQVASGAVTSRRAELLKKVSVAPAVVAKADPTPAPAPAAPPTPPSTAPSGGDPPVAPPPVASAAPPPKAPVSQGSPGLPTRQPRVAVTPAAPASPSTPTVITPLPPPEPTLPPTPAGIVASIQGRLVALLDNLLDKGVRTPKPVVPPTRKTVYRGADADLLRLQEEVIALALEALGAPPAAKPAEKQ